MRYTPCSVNSRMSRGCPARLGAWLPSRPARRSPPRPARPSFVLRRRVRVRGATDAGPAGPAGRAASRARRPGLPEPGCSAPATRHSAAAQGGPGARQHAGRRASALNRRPARAAPAAPSASRAVPSAAGGGRRPAQSASQTGSSAPSAAASPPSWLAWPVHLHRGARRVNFDKVHGACVQARPFGGLKHSHDAPLTPFILRVTRFSRVRCTLDTWEPELSSQANDIHMKCRPRAKDTGHQGQGQAVHVRSSETVRASRPSRAYRCTTMSARFIKRMRRLVRVTTKRRRATSKRHRVHTLKVDRSAGHRLKRTGARPWWRAGRPARAATQTGPPPQGAIH